VGGTDNSTQPSPVPYKNQWSTVYGSPRLAGGWIVIELRTNNPVALNVTGGVAITGDETVGGQLTVVGSIQGNSNIQTLSNLLVNGGIYGANSSVAPNFPVGLLTVNLTVNNSPFAFPPVGSIVMYGAAAAPPGWLVCSGGLVPPQYTALIAVIGPNLPDLRSRVPIGFGLGPGLSQYNLFDTGGAEQVSLTIDQIPAHIHSISPTPLWANRSAGLGWGQNGNIISDNGPTQTGSVGGGLSHENRQPFLAVNYIIKF